MASLYGTRNMALQRRGALDRTAQTNPILTPYNPANQISTDLTGTLIRGNAQDQSQRNRFHLLEGQRAQLLARTNENAADRALDMTRLNTQSQQFNQRLNLDERESGALNQYRQAGLGLARERLATDTQMRTQDMLLGEAERLRAGNLRRDQFTEDQRQFDETTQAKRIENVRDAQYKRKTAEETQGGVRLQDAYRRRQIALSNPNVPQSDLDAINEEIRSLEGGGQQAAPQFGGALARPVAEPDRAEGLMALPSIPKAYGGSTRDDFVKNSLTPQARARLNQLNPPRLIQVDQETEVNLQRILARAKQRGETLTREEALALARRM